MKDYGGRYVSKHNHKFHTPLAKTGDSTQTLTQLQRNPQFIPHWRHGRPTGKTLNFKSELLASQLSAWRHPLTNEGNAQLTSRQKQKVITNFAGASYAVGSSTQSISQKGIQ